MFYEWAAGVNGGDPIREVGQTPLKGGSLHNPCHFESAPVTTPWSTARVSHRPD